VLWVTPARLALSAKRFYQIALDERSTIAHRRVICSLAIAAALAILHKAMAPTPTPKICFRSRRIEAAQIL
jgi:hypothetical protein